MQHGRGLFGHDLAVAPCPARGTPADLPEAVMQAIAESAPCWPAGPPAAECPETLVSFDLDGFRYALTRQRLADTVQLSPREVEIVDLVASGLPNKCIGAVLEISTWTVATHLRRIFAKLGVNSRAAMVAHHGRRGARGPVPQSAGYQRSDGHMGSVNRSPNSSPQALSASSPTIFSDVDTSASRGLTSLHRAVRSKY